jgi:hypothetical protein
MRRAFRQLLAKFVFRDRSSLFKVPNLHSLVHSVPYRPRGKRGDT